MLSHEVESKGSSDESQGLTRARRLTCGAATDPFCALVQVADELLSRLHVVRCPSSMQLLATLLAMPSRLEAWQVRAGGWVGACDLRVCGHFTSRALGNCAV